MALRQRLKRVWNAVFLPDRDDLSEPNVQQSTVAGVQDAVDGTSPEEFERIVGPWETIRHFVGCVTLIAVALGFFSMLKDIAPHVAGRETAVKLFGFDFVQYLVWLPTLVGILVLGAYVRVRKLKRNNEKHLGTRNRRLEEEVARLRFTLAGVAQRLENLRSEFGPVLGWAHSPVTKNVEELPEMTPDQAGQNVQKVLLDFEKMLSDNRSA